MSNFRLWGPPLTPLWGANPRNPRHFSADPHGDLRAKFGEDRPVNKGTLLKKTGQLDHAIVSYLERERIFVRPTAFAGLPPGQEAHRRREDLAAAEPFSEFLYFSL